MTVIVVHFSYYEILQIFKLHSRVLSMFLAGNNDNCLLISATFPAAHYSFEEAHHIKSTR